MRDRELWDALTVLARHLDLLDPGERLTTERVPIPEPALCLAYGTYGEVRLCCTYGKDHAGACTWERAMVGKSACVARSHFATSPDVTVHECQRPAGHSGEHKATGPDGVRWTWGDAPRELTPSEKYRCGAQEWGTNGHRMSCVLVRGHEGAHRGVDADGNSTVTWPCPCYPAPCTGHTVPSAVFAPADPTRCASTQPGSGMRCIRQAGHEGEHRKLMRRWSDADPATTDEPGTVCEAPSPLQPGPDCVYRAGHVGSHSNDPTEPRAS